MINKSTNIPTTQKVAEQLIFMLQENCALTSADISRLNYIITENRQQHINKALNNTIEATMKEIEAINYSLSEISKVNEKEAKLWHELLATKDLQNKKNYLHKILAIATADQKIITAIEQRLNNVANNLQNISAEPSLNETQKNCIAQTQQSIVTTTELLNNYYNSRSAYGHELRTAYNAGTTPIANQHIKIAEQHLSLANDAKIKMCICFGLCIGCSIATLLTIIFPPAGLVLSLLISGLIAGISLAAAYGRSEFHNKYKKELNKHKEAKNIEAASDVITEQVTSISKKSTKNIATAAITARKSPQLFGRQSTQSSTLPKKDSPSGNLEPPHGKKR